MIGFLRGVLAAKHPPQLIVDVNGVGYEIEAPMSTFYVLPAVGSEVKLVTHLHVREDAQILFGFSTEAERRLFRDLIRISGVGAKMALAILSGISIDGFVRCVQEEDTASLIKVPGVGKKTAERLIVEMRDRIEKGAQMMPSGTKTTAEARPTAAAEAQNALVALGYRPAEAVRLLASVDTEGRSTEDIIRQALQNLAAR
jgi:Holliday junction DNA helicase RuvA